MTSSFPQEPDSSWMLPTDAPSVARNVAPSPFNVCDGICEGEREEKGEGAKIRGWQPRKTCGYSTIDLIQRH